MELGINIDLENLTLESITFRDIKDPCPVFDGFAWHIYGSLGNSKVEVWKIFHATSSSLNGPWTFLSPVELIGITGGRIAAPGVIYDNNDGLFHMFVQSDFMEVNTSVYHLTSSDGEKFTLVDIPFRSIPDTNEASIYDPHPAIINGKKYISYSGAPRVGRPDIYIAVSQTNTWYGPWERVGMILSHSEVPHHNQHDHNDYEWGLEGSQLIELPNKQILLNAVCFLPDGIRGTRQRVFFALSENINGPFKTLGPVINPPSLGWDSGENGHASGVVEDESLVLFYQARSKPEEDPKWRYGQKTFAIKKLLFS